MQAFIPCLIPYPSMFQYAIRPQPSPCASLFLMGHPTRSLDPPYLAIPLSQSLPGLPETYNSMGRYTTQGLATNSMYVLAREDLSASSTVGRKGGSTVIGGPASPRVVLAGGRVHEKSSIGPLFIIEVAVSPYNNIEGGPRAPFQILRSISGWEIVSPAVNKGIKLGITRSWGSLIPYQHRDKSG
jgi:hypothetical protein